ncbi:MAG: hypothetical protein C0397_02005 [Odoribacter sp.]|nr:hypothetical protein [Odoribacter sp.]
MSKAKLLIFFLSIFLLGDLTYSFLQYYYTPLDGDISAGVVPSAHVQQVLDDPFGFHLLSTGEKHVNPNRFFAHFLFMEYMQKVPLWLQNLTDPITSVYLSCAFMKILIHFLLLFLLSALISGTRNILDKKFLICAALIIPFIQANGYWGHMGINDRSTTYTFFYALPVILLMVFLMPFYSMVFLKEIQMPNVIRTVFLFALAIILPLSGPLIPGLVLIVAGLIGIHYLRYFSWADHSISTDGLLSGFRKIPAPIYIFLIPICLVSLYSLFLGRFDLNYTSETIPLADRYMRLPLGIYYQISQSLGVPLLLIIIGLNVFLIKKRFYTPEGKKIIGALKWIGIFSAVYIFLLPLGGYRPYRPNILRYDTFMPVTIALLYFYGLSTNFLIGSLKFRAKKVYMVGLLAFFAIYMNADRLETDKYYCERNALVYLANSTDKITLLPTNCNVMSWDHFDNPKWSEKNAIMLKYWRITKDVKLYYHPGDQK